MYSDYAAQERNRSGLKFKQHILKPTTRTMKLFSLVVATSCLAASAFGVTPVSKNIANAKASVPASPLRKDTAFDSPLFREASLVRGGAVPGWAAYNDSLDKNPLTTKAFTSLVGWALGDILAQVRHIPFLDPATIPLMLILILAVVHRF